MVTKNNAPNRPVDSKLREVLGAFSITRISVVYVEILAIIVFLIWVPSTFGAVITFTGILNDNAVTALVALALVAPLAAGVFDLSVGYCLGATSVFAAWLLGNTGFNTAEVVVVCILFAMVVGCVNGLIVVVMRVDSFIATLATGAILLAVILIISGDQTLNQGFTSSFLKLGQAKVGQITAPVFVALAVTLILWYVLGHTALGRQVYATGLAEESARLAGIRTRLIRFVSLVVSATLAGIAGILLAAVVTAGSPTVGPSYLIPAFAAAFLGATQFRDRLFNAWGTVFAVLLLGTLTSGLALAGAPLWMPDIFQGVVLIVALALGSLQSRGATGAFAVFRRRTAPKPHAVELPGTTGQELRRLADTASSGRTVGDRSDATREEIGPFDVRLLRREPAMGRIADAGVNTAERIETLEATELARAALVRYADATDAKDIEAMTAVFAIDATMQVDDATFAGRAAIIDYFTTTFGSAPSPKAHFVTNIRVVAASPAEVTLASYFIYLSTGAAPSLDGWGMYRDTIRVVDGRAEIVRMQMTGSWNGADAPNGQLSWRTESA